MELVNGPWKNIFTGNWDGYEIEVKENPDKEILTLIYEKKKSGVISVLTKFYYAQGNVTRLLEDFKNYSVVIEKQFPTHKSVFFSLSSGPRYSSLETLNDTIEESFKLVEMESEELNEKTKEYSITITQLNRVDEEIQKDLFSDPLLLPGLLSRKETSAEFKVKAVKIFLGKTLKGEKAEEEIENFKSTLIIGDEEERKKALHVLIENFVLAGRNAIVLDYDNSYSKMNYPNKDYDYKKSKDLQPIGLPIKHAEVSDVGIGLKQINSKILLETFSLDSENPIAGETNKILSTTFEKHASELESLEDLEVKVLSNTDETKKFHIYRAARWLKVLEKKYPGYFKGRTSHKKLIPSYSRAMGTIIRVDVSGELDAIKKTLLYTLTKSMVEDYKEQAASSQLKTGVFIEKGNKYFPSKPVKEVETEQMKETMRGFEYGLGIVTGAESEASLNEDLVENATMKMTFVSKNEVAVKEKNSRPYRIQLRQNLTS